MAAFLNMRVILAMLVITLLLALSFFRYSAYHYPFLDSDMAIHVLMARGFEFYHNLYYWGQTRLGSLMPFLAFFPWKLGMDALMATSLVQYGMVVVTLIGVMLLGGGTPSFGAVLFAGLFLFPVPALVYGLMPGHPALAHVMLSVLGAVSAMRAGGLSFREDAPWLTVAALSSFLAVWVSDLALITAPVIWAWMLFRIRQSVSKQMLLTVGAMTALLPLLVCVFKGSRVDYSGYADSGIAGLGAALDGVRGHASLLFEAVGMTGGVTWSGVLAALMVLALVLLAVQMVNMARTKGLVSVLRSPAALFLVLAVVTYSATLASGWAATNGYESRYLCVPVTFLFLALSTGSEADAGLRWPLRTVLAAAVFASVLSFGEYRHDGGKFIADREAKQRLRSMDKTAIIGDYWFCYAMAAYHADGILAMPFYEDFFRNSHQLDMVFQRDSIFVCTSPRYPALADTLHQHGRVLVRASEPEFMVGNSVLARYSVLP